MFDLDDTLFPRLSDNYTSADVECIKPYDGAKELLTLGSYRSFLLSAGVDSFQRKKLEVLGLHSCFHRIIIVEKTELKQLELLRLKQEFPFSCVWVIGDRLDAEIQYGNEQGFYTIRFHQGKYAFQQAQHQLQEPKMVIRNYKELGEVLLCKR